MEAIVIRVITEKARFEDIVYYDNSGEYVKYLDIHTMEETYALEETYYLRDAEKEDFDEFGYPSLEFVPNNELDTILI